MRTVYDLIQRLSTIETLARWAAENEYVQAQAHDNPDRTCGNLHRAAVAALAAATTSTGNPLDLKLYIARENGIAAARDLAFASSALEALTALTV